jgi:hypothetical protein
LVIKHRARDTTLRGTAMAELESMTPRSSQYLPGTEIPEEQWFYRFAKKYWFNDFGAYHRQGTRNAEISGAPSARTAILGD